MACHVPSCTGAFGDRFRSRRLQSSARPRGDGGSAVVRAGAEFSGWLKDQPREEFAFARAAGQKPVSSQAARAYLRGMLKKAGIEKKISPHKLRHTYATNLLDAGAELVDIQALLGHVNPATTQIYTYMDQDRTAAVVNKL